MYQKLLFPFFTLLFWFTMYCQAERVIVNMANGGTSRPILLHPLAHDAHKQSHSAAQALQHDDPFDAPWEVGKEGSTVNDTDSVPQKIDGNKKSTADADKNAELTDISDNYGKNKPGKFQNQTHIDGIEYDEKKQSTKHSTQHPTASTTIPKTNTTASTTTIFRTTAHLTTLPQDIITQPVTAPGFNSNTTAAPCHQSCLEALSSLKLYSNNSLTVPQGTDLTLVCQLPLNEAMYVENLIWLFHKINSPEGQCSLTSQEFLPSCPGFPTITNTDDRNVTFLQQVLTLANLKENNTGQYMCQVKVTCCPGSEEHLMSEEHIMDVAVSVWRVDYITDLAVAGTLAVVLIILLIVVTIWLHRRHVSSYKSLHNNNMSSNTIAVLHLPLIEDDDDSFDSDENE